MSFKPIGGFPSFIRIKDKIEKETLETRGFSTNIVSIGDIMDKKKKQDLFLAFGSDDESGIDFMFDNMFNKPYTYDEIIYEEKH